MSRNLGKQGTANSPRKAEHLVPWQLAEAVARAAAEAVVSTSAAWCAVQR